MNPIPASVCELSLLTNFTPRKFTKDMTFDYLTLNYGPTFCDEYIPSQPDDKDIAVPHSSTSSEPM